MKTISDMVGDYIDNLRSLNYSGRSITEYRYRCAEFAAFLKDTFGLENAVLLRQDHLHAWQKHVARQKNAGGHPIAPSTMNQKITNTRELLRHMARKGFIRHHLIEEVERVREPKMLPVEAFEHRQIRKVLGGIDISNPEGHRDRTFLELLYTTGIRVSELERLDLGSADLKRGTLRVFGKNRKERVVPVGKTALRFLESHIRAVRPLMLKRGKDEQALFLNSRGGRMRYDLIRETVHKYCDGKMGFNVTPHSFRRSCVTEMVKANANLYHTKEMLGHESLETLKHYTKLTIADLKKTHARCHPREKDL